MRRQRECPFSVQDISAFAFSTFPSFVFEGFVGVGIGIGAPAFLNFHQIQILVVGNVATIVIPPVEVTPTVVVGERGRRRCLHGK